MGLAEALELLNKRAAAGLVVYRLDRLARDLVLQEQLLAECWRSEAQVFSTSKAEGDYLRNDPSDPFPHVDSASVRRGGSVREGHDSAKARGWPQAQTR